MRKPLTSIYSKQMMQFVAQRMMELDVEGLCAAGYDIKSVEHTNSRNGYRDCLWQIRTGDSLE